MLFYTVALNLTLSFSDSLYGQTAPAPPGMTPLFDGKTLDGWIDQENSANQFDGGDIKDVSGFAKKLVAKSDPVSACLNEKLGKRTSRFWPITLPRLQIPWWHPPNRRQPIPPPKNPRRRRQKQAS